MEFNNFTADLIKQVVNSSLPLVRRSPGTQLSAGAGSGCLIVYKDRLFFVGVQPVSDTSGLQIALGKAPENGTVYYPLPWLLFIDPLGEAISEIGEPLLQKLQSLSLCYVEIKDALDLSQAEIQLGGITIEAEERKAVFSGLDALPSAEGVFTFYENRISDLSGEGIDQKGKLVSGLKYAGKAGPFERFYLEASMMESLDFKTTMGAPVFSETGELVAFVASADLEQKLVYAFPVGLLQENLDDALDTNSKSVEEIKPVEKPEWEDEGLEGFKIDPVKKEYITYSVLYGTNRSPVLKSNKLSFGTARDRNLHLGNCNISIPLKHELGKIERPGWFQKLLFKESPEKHFTILSNEETDEARFMELLRQKIGQSEEKDVLLFIHGFNVSFDDAMMRAAQLGYDLNFKGGVAAFSWPSLGTISGYVADSDSAGYSRLFLSAFIKLLVQPGTQKLHIIAHSMGNVVLTQALLQLKEEGLFPNPAIHQVILAAPDLDKDIFLNQILPAINGASKFTLYASDKDNALIASKKIRKGYGRLGEGGDNIVVVDGVDSIDASGVNTDLLGHGYFSDTQPLLNDIHLVFSNLPPAQRVLEAKSKMINSVSKSYWAFKNT